MKFRITERESGEFIVQYIPDFYPRKPGVASPWVGDQIYSSFSSADACVARLAKERRDSFKRLNIVKSYEYNEDGLRIDEVEYV